MQSEVVYKQEKYQVIDNPGQSGYKMVPEKPWPERYMGISFFKSPEVIQGEISQNGHFNGNGRCYLEADRKKTGKDEKESHIHQYSWASDNCEFNEFLKLFWFDLHAL